MQPDRKREIELSHDRLLTALHYDADTGVFTWRIKYWTRGPDLTGKEAGGTHDRGYKHIKLYGTYFYAHRLAWFYMTGSWPEAQIDHRNGDTKDNSWKNLREATCAQNGHNAKTQVRNTTGFPGVRRRPGGRYQARITAHGVDRTVGSFATFEEAVAARKKAKAEHHPFQPEHRD